MRYDLNIRNYLIGPRADAFFLGPGATILVTAVLLGLRRLGPGAAIASDAMALGLTWVFIGPHYAATYQRAYSSAAVVRAHPWVTLAAPPLLLAATVVAVRHPYDFGLVYFASYVAFTGYHYSGQSLGLALLYPARQGAPLEPLEKRLLAAPLYLSWILTLLGLFGALQPGRNAAFAFVRGRYQGPPVPPWVLLVGLGTLAGSFAGVAWVAARRKRRGVPLPWPTYAVLSAQTLWFTLGLYEPFFNIMLVPVFHAIQYVAFTGWHASRGPSSTRVAPGRPVRRPDGAAGVGHLPRQLQILHAGPAVPRPLLHDGGRRDVSQSPSLPARRSHLADARARRAPDDARLTRADAAESDRRLLVRAAHSDEKR